MLDLVQDATLLSFVVIGGFLLGYVYRECYELYERRKEERRLFPKGTYRTYHYKGNVTLETGTLVNLKLPPFDKIAGLMKVGNLYWSQRKDGSWEVTISFTTYKPPKILKTPYKVETGKEKIVITSPGVYQIGPLKADGRVTIEKKAEPDKSWETPPIIYEEKVDSASEELQKVAIEDIYGKGYLEAAKEPKEEPKEHRGYYIQDVQGIVAYVAATSEEEALAKFMNGKCHNKPDKGRNYFARLAGQPTSPPPPPPMY